MWNTVQLRMLIDERKQITRTGISFCYLYYHKLASIIWFPYDFRLRISISHTFNKISFSLTRFFRILLSIFIVCLFFYFVWSNILAYVSIYLSFLSWSLIFLVFAFFKMRMNYNDVGRTAMVYQVVGTRMNYNDVTSTLPTELLSCSRP